jgi:hypothetical protein
MSCCMLIAMFTNGTVNVRRDRPCPPPPLPLLCCLHLLRSYRACPLATSPHRPPHHCALPWSSSPTPPVHSPPPPLAAGDAQPPTTAPRLHMGQPPPGWTGLQCRGCTLSTRRVVHLSIANALQPNKNRHLSEPTLYRPLINTMLDRPSQRPGKPSSSLFPSHFASSPANFA